MDSQTEELVLRVQAERDIERQARRVLQQRNIELERRTRALEGQLRILEIDHQYPVDLDVA